MINKKEFINFVKSYEIFENGVNCFSECLHSDGLWECEWIDAVSRMWDQFMYSHFTEEGSDLINWWKFEDVDHIIWQKTDPDLFNGKSEIEYNVNELEDLWDYLIKYKENYLLND